MKILVLGAGGMLGNAVLRVMSGRKDFSVYGTLRSNCDSLKTLAPHAKIIQGFNAESYESLIECLVKYRPEIVINCIGLIKQAPEISNPLITISINSLLPHRLAKMCDLINARLVHISTDCVFSGQKGNYIEEDTPDALDIYGRSKLLGEVNYKNAITIRTSIIGHEIKNVRGLIGWFLNQQGVVKGYTQAIFSGLPTYELARLICDYVIPNKNISGLYHVSSSPISKFDLLELVSNEYNKTIRIIPDDTMKVDRSLNSSLFTAATGYVAPFWPELVTQMKKFG